MSESDGPLTGWESGAAATHAPLRSAKNVLITPPHTGEFCNVYLDLAMPTVEHNLRQFLSGHAVGMANIVRRGGARARLNTSYLENNDSEAQPNLRSVFQAAIRAALAASRSPSPSHSSA
jgi:hypothetical protein